MLHSGRAARSSAVTTNNIGRRQLCSNQRGEREGEEAFFSHSLALSYWGLCNIVRVIVDPSVQEVCYFQTLGGWEDGMSGGGDDHLQVGGPCRLEIPALISELL